MTWRELLDGLKLLTDNELEGEAAIRPHHPDATKPVALHPVIAFGRLCEMDDSVEPDIYCTDGEVMAERNTFALYNDWPGGGVVGDWNDTTKKPWED